MSIAQSDRSPATTDRARELATLAASIYKRGTFTGDARKQWEEADRTHDECIEELELAQQLLGEALSFAQKDVTVVQLTAISGRVDQARSAIRKAWFSFQGTLFEDDVNDRSTIYGSHCHAYLYRVRLCLYLGLGVPGSAMPYDGLADVADTPMISKLLNRSQAAVSKASKDAAVLAQMLYSMWPESLDMEMPPELPSSIVQYDDPIMLGQELTERRGELEHAKNSLLAAIAERVRVISQAEGELRQLVQAGKAAGLSWRQLGNAAGITGSAVMRKYDADARRRHSDYKRVNARIDDPDSTTGTSQA